MKTNLLVILILLLGLTAQAQTGSVSGTIFSDQGQPLEFANVSLKGTSLGAATAQDGKFAINDVPSGNYTLMVSTIGYGTATRSITVNTDQTTSVDIRLTE